MVDVSMGHVEGFNLHLQWFEGLATNLLGSSEGLHVVGQEIHVTIITTGKVFSWVKGYKHRNVIELLNLTLSLCHSVDFIGQCEVRSMPQSNVASWWVVHSQSKRHLPGA